MRPLLILVIALLPAGASAQAMYKCVDSRGITRYTDQPQPGCKGREVDIRGQPLISDGPPPQSKDARELERDYQRRKINEGRVREAEEKAAATKERECAQMQAEIQRLESGRRIIRFDEKGGQSYVEDDERERRAAQLRDEMAQKCR